MNGDVYKQIYDLQKKAEEQEQKINRLEAKVEALETLDVVNTQIMFNHKDSLESLVNVINEMYKAGLGL